MGLGQEARRPGGLPQWLLQAQPQTKVAIIIILQITEASSSLSGGGGASLVGEEPELVHQVESKSVLLSDTP